MSAGEEKVGNTPTPEAKRLPTPDSRYFDVVVIGGGVIGCSVAYSAARRGASVALFEAERIASGASGAAAGMLNAQAESHEPGPLLDLMLESRKMHGPLCEALREETGLDPEYVRAGTLRAATSEGFAEKLAKTYFWQKRKGLSARWLDGEEARELEPGLSSGVLAALYFPKEGQVNSPRLTRALALGAAGNGAEILEAEPVTDFLTQNGKVSGVRTVHGEVSAGSVVLAGGVAGGRLAAEVGIQPPAHPVKGEILTVEAGRSLVKSNVWNEDCYLVSKRDGRVVIGATEEPNVFDRRPTLEGVAKLSGAAVKLVPEIRRSTFRGAWGGLRPATPDGLPVLGPVEGLENLFVATGHYRNGVLLAPVTGEIVSALALGEEPSVDLSPFHHRRGMESAKP
ncbi:MAG: glycine oxidase ThiO [Rubrobacteraceae bacterium]